jgi:single-strand DNA-binding protein
MNKAVLLGRLVREPETRTTSSQIPVTTFTIAINRPYKDSEGNRQADFIPIVCWRKQAELVATHFHKGDRITVVGSIQTRSYDDKEGNKRNITEVVADEIGFVDSKKTDDTERSPYDV